jgi:hypothetical protein
MIFYQDGIEKNMMKIGKGCKKMPIMKFKGA